VVIFDDQLPNFGLRVTRADAKAFISQRAGRGKRMVCLHAWAESTRKCLVGRQSRSQRMRMALVKK